MGRNKIKIEKIANERNRQATFFKRKNGLFKKAMELSILCDCDIALLVFSPQDKLFRYATTDVESVLQRHTNCKEEPQQDLTNEDYFRQFAPNDDPVPTEGEQGSPSSKKPRRRDLDSTTGPTTRRKRSMEEFEEDGHLDRVKRERKVSRIETDAHELNGEGQIKPEPFQYSPSFQEPSQMPFMSFPPRPVEVNTNDSTLPPFSSSSAFYNSSSSSSWPGSSQNSNSSQVPVGPHSPVSTQLPSLPPASQLQSGSPHSEHPMPLTPKSSRPPMFNNLTISIPSRESSTVPSMLSPLTSPTFCPKIPLESPTTLTTPNPTLFSGVYPRSPRTPTTPSAPFPDFSMQPAFRLPHLEAAFFRGGAGDEAKSDPNMNLQLPSLNGKHAPPREQRS